MAHPVTLWPVPYIFVSQILFNLPFEFFSITSIVLIELLRIIQNKKWKNLTSLGDWGILYLLKGL